MYTIEKIISLFPGFSNDQTESLSRLGELYGYWNERVNLISRKDMEHFYSRHVLHSLSVGMYFNLDGSRVIDIGTGGGFPGVPLAILFPEAQFTLVDSIGKKLKVVDEVAKELKLSNIETRHSRIEEMDGRFDYLTGRAVKSLPQIYTWSKHLVNWDRGKENSGMLYLKGGEFQEELNTIPKSSDVFPLSEKLDDDDFFETKKLIHVYQAKSKPTV